MEGKINRVERQFAFIGEWGCCSSDFNKAGISRHYILTALIADENYITELESELELIKRKHLFENPQGLKSVGNDDVKRIKILEDLKEMKFHFYSLVVDKQRIVQASGLGYEGSFLKHFNGVVYKKLYSAYPELQIVAAESDDDDFMKSFRKYVIEHSQPTLFEMHGFGFSARQSEICLQFAEFIADTIAKGYEDNERTEKYKAFMNLLREKLIAIEHWPESYEDYIVDLSNYGETEYDTVIAQQAIRLANNFIKNNEISDKPEIQEQVLCLRFLISMLRSQRYNQYFSSYEIISNLNAITGKKYTDHYFKTRIVAKLRDAGVLIASSAQGYKLPVSQKELYDFVNQSSSMIMPMLLRLNKCREQVRLATKNELDLFDKPEYSNLKNFFEVQ